MSMLADPVNHPSHYTDGKYETIDFIESHGLGFHLGNAVKYISRAGKKNPAKEIEDLNKAIWYLERAKISPFAKVLVPAFNTSRISPDDYARDKGLSDELRYAIDCIVDGEIAQHYNSAIVHIKTHIKIKALEEENEQPAW